MRLAGGEKSANIYAGSEAIWVPIWSRSMSATSLGSKIDPILNRITHFLGTSPDDAHNRHRMIFFLVVLFCLGIGYELHCDKSAADSAVRESLIKTFSNT